MKTRLVGFTAVAVFSLLCMGGVASARTKTYKAKAVIQKGDPFCNSTEPTPTVMGTVKFKRTGNTVTITVTLTHGAPNTSYYGELASSLSCTGLGPSVELTTNSHGKGKKSGSQEVQEAEKEFFVGVYPITAFEPNVTPPVTLP